MRAQLSFVRALSLAERCSEAKSASRRAYRGEFGEETGRTISRRAIADGQAQDRNAAAAGRSDNRLGAPGRTAVRQRAWTMSTSPTHRVNPQIFCAITRTNPRAHDIIAGISIGHRCSRVLSTRRARVIALRSRTRSIASPTGTDTRCFLNPRALIRISSIPTGSALPFPADVQLAMLRHDGGFGAGGDGSAGLCRRV